MSSAPPRKKKPVEDESCIAVVGYQQQYHLSNGTTAPTTTSTISSDVVGVIAGFIPQTTADQLDLMLVSNTWYRGVVEQDGMKAKPGIFWPWCALQTRKPSSVTIGRVDENVMDRLTSALPNLSELKVRGRISDEGCEYLSKFEELTSLDVCGKVSPEAPILERASSLEQLMSLIMTDFPISDDDLSYIATNFPQLTALNMNTTTTSEEFPASISDGGVKELQELKHLESLCLCDSQKKLTDDSQAPPLG